jgi:hypothetical protein
VGRGLGQGSQQQVQPLVGTNDAEEKQAGSRGGRRRSFGGLILRDGGREVRGHGYGPHRRARGQFLGLGGLGGGVGDHRAAPAEQGAGQGDVAGAAFVRQDVVADDRGFRAAQGAHDGEVDGNLDRGQQDEDDQVGGPEPTAGGEPAVRAVPGQPAVGARVGLALRDVDGLLARVEPPGVLGTPGLDDHVVAGRGQVVGQFGGVPGPAALVRVGRADQRDPQGFTYRCESGRSGRPAGPARRGSCRSRRPAACRWRRAAGARSGRRWP